MSENIVHSTVDVSVNPNYTTAFMSFTAPQNGGSEMTVAGVMSALAASKVSYGIMEDAITEAVENKRYDQNICVAYWTPPVDGTDGSVTYMFKTAGGGTPVEDENGIVDYKNLGIVQNITAGTVIAQITFPTEGTPGTDIMGRTVAQKKGVPAAVRAGTGTSLINDGAQLIAAVDGNLRFERGSFSVDETLVINKDVDVSVGNIDFIGSVSVRGNVCEGFRIASKKDIKVQGSCNSAVLTADGSITVGIGSINSTINAKGNVKLGFCENSKITCDGTVESVSFVGGEVFAGKDILATGKGVIVGGKYTALNSIEASIIGSENYTRTILTLGNNAVLYEERESLKRQITEMEDKADQLGKILTTLTELAKTSRLSPDREQMKTDALRNRLRLQSEVRKGKARIVEINAALELSQNLTVKCRRCLYPGVTLTINSSVEQVNTMNSCCRATVENGEIVIKPL